MNERSYWNSNGEAQALYDEMQAAAFKYTKATEALFHSYYRYYNDGDLPEGLDSLFETHAVAYRQAEAEIAREHAVTGDDKVADASEPRKRKRRRAELRTEAHNLGEAARCERRHCVVSEVERLRYASRHGVDVLRGAADFEPDHVRPRVDAEVVAADDLLPAFSLALVRRGERDRRWTAYENLLRVARPRERRIFKERAALCVNPVKQVARRNFYAFGEIEDMSLAFAA